MKCAFILDMIVRCTSKIANIWHAKIAQNLVISTIRYFSNNKSVIRLSSNEVYGSVRIVAECFKWCLRGLCVILPVSNSCLGADILTIN